MKLKILSFFLLFSIQQICSQDLQLFEHMWTLTSLTIDDENVEIPENDEVDMVLLEFFKDPPHQFSTLVCNSTSADISFNDDNSTFSITNGLNTTLILCDRSDSQSFENKYFNFFEVGAASPFIYTLTTEENTTTLTITTESGNIAIYESRVLYLESNSLSNYLFVQNSIDDYFILKTNQKNESFKINLFAINGKHLVVNHTLKHNLPFSTSIFSTGIYIIEIKNKRGQSAIRKFVIRR